MTNEELVRRYAEASMKFDYDALGALRHAEWTTIWPQSGEVLLDSNNYRAVTENYPGGRPRVVQEQLVGSEDRWAVSPLGAAYRVAGEGESWWTVWRMTYPDGKVYFSIVLIEVRDGRIWRETNYWAEPFDPPEWRRPYVRLQGAGRSA